jgi:plasmid replication initiation protein
MLLNAFRQAEMPTQQSIQRTFSYVYLPILLRLPTNTLRLPTNTPTFTLHNPKKYNTKELLDLILISNMSDLIVKDNALMNASYNLDLVEQRLILLAILEARESGKGINANDPLTVHAESYINQFGVARQTAYQALKDACKDLFARQFSYQEKRERGRANITSRWVSQIAYIDETATVEVIFAPAVVPLITRLEEQFTSMILSKLAAYRVLMQSVYELLICWRSTGKTPVIELAEFRKRLGVLDMNIKIR